MGKIYISEDPNLNLYSSQWHPTKNGKFTPENTTPSSNTDIWWVCSDFSDHEWEAMPLARIGQQQGCPICSNKKILTGFNDFAHVQTELMKQWHPTLNTLNPEEIAPSANKDAWWLCPVGEDHVWSAKINSRVSGGNKCPYCANRKVLAGFNDLGSSSHEQIIKEWHSTKNEKKITEVSVASNQKVWWLCENGHEWEAVIANRTTKGSGCKDCKKLNKTPIIKETVDKSKLSDEWHEDNDRKASEVSTGSNYEALWQCLKDSRHVWTATVSNRMRGSGCLVCSDRKVIEGVNDLSSNCEFSYLVDQWHPDNEMKPTEVAIGTDIDIKWICSESHVWKAKLYSRITKGSNCPECFGRNPWTQEKKTIATFPVLLSQFHRSNHLKADQIPFRSSKIITWVCSKNDKHLWSASAASRLLDGSDCPVCAGRKVITGVNDLASDPKWNFLVNEWHEDNLTKPTEVSYSSNVLIKWVCTVNKEHIWETVLSARVHATSPSGCPECALAAQTSKGEADVYAIMETLGFKPQQRNTKVIIGGELDIYIPEEKFAIEYNGVYWHSEARGRDRFYHAVKLEKCVNKGIDLYNIWEDDWRSNQELIIRDVAKRLNVLDKVSDVFPNTPDFWLETIDASETSIRVLSEVEAEEFLKDHHLEGYASGEINLGLVDAENKIRAVAIASSGATQELFIARYATAGIVVNGLSKFTDSITTSQNVKRVTIFSDLSHENGKMYIDNGFIEDEYVEPDFTLLAKGRRMDRSLYTLDKFKEDSDLVFVEGLSIRELANINNLHRVWDFGKKRYTKNVIREVGK